MSRHLVTVPNGYLLDLVEVAELAVETFKTKTVEEHVAVRDRQAAVLERLGLVRRTGHGRADS